jgi:hypothetical protein
MIRLTSRALWKNTGGALNTVAAGMNRTAIRCRARTQLSSCQWMTMPARRIHAAEGYTSNRFHHETNSLTKSCKGDKLSQESTVLKKSWMTPIPLWAFIMHQ